MFGIGKHNREFYKSDLWKSIDPSDRAHIILVAERAKPAAHCSFLKLKGVKEIVEKELNIYITNPRGRINFYPGSNKLALPNNVVTVCASKKIFDIYEKLTDNIQLGQKFQEMEGKLLGYPPCCRREYLNPTYRKKYNDWILKFFRRPYTFEIECVQTLLDGKEIPEVFLYLMPSQTPCSINCGTSISLLSKWKSIIEKYDPEAAATIREFNERCDLNKFKKNANRLKSMKVTPEMFKKGYIFEK